MKKTLMLAGMLVLLAGTGPTSGADIVSGGGIHTNLLVYSGSPCARWNPIKPNGTAYRYGYCSNRGTPGYQVQRDTFYYYNGTTPVVTLKVLLTCYVDVGDSDAQRLYCP